MEVFATRAWKPERTPQIIFHHPGVVDYAYKASAGRGDKRILGLRWPASLTKAGNSGSTETSCLKKENKNLRLSSDLHTRSCMSIFTHTLMHTASNTKVTLIRFFS